MLFERPKQNEHGWYVCTLESNPQYLHSDCELYMSTYNNVEGKHTGYFATEVEAYRAMYDYNVTL
jgi:hypothetical protein